MTKTELFTKARNYRYSQKQLKIKNKRKDVEKLKDDLKLKKELDYYENLL